MRTLDESQWAAFSQLVDDLERLPIGERQNRLRAMWEHTDAVVLHYVALHFRLAADDIHWGGARPAIPGFAIVGEIGFGGMGIVYEARELALGRRVAIKVLAPHLNSRPRHLERFRREAMAGARLNNSGILTVHRVEYKQVLPYIVLELVEGGDNLEKRLRILRDRVGLPTDHYEKSSRLVERVARAMQVAHDAGIVHRDIKPSNILLTSEGAPKVADFGLALLEDVPDLTGEGALGTPYYMSPEQIVPGARVDHRADIYSLGVVLYELLALVRPFEADSCKRILHRIVTEEPINPGTVRPGAPKDLETICLKAIAKEPERRYSSMSLFADDLLCFLEHRPISARRLSSIDRIVLWVARSPGRGIATMVSALLLLAVRDRVIRSTRRPADLVQLVLVI